MRLNSLSFKEGGHCILTFEKPEGWLRATWTGYVDTEEAMQGATNYLNQVGPFHCLYLLNDNVALRGPWFDSTRWLECAWLPQAQRLGLRYVAHVVQADTHIDIMTLKYPQHHIVDALELQLFHDVAMAEEWLRSCQQPVSQPAFQAN
ncbi:MAG: hypothetical protein EOO56_00800 [Hymenobacter sp.]|nr:MAG: hypothetical protein EOO56_00800 [Hymenobacter sp.]